VSGRWPVVKIIAESLSQRDEKHVVPTPLSGLRVGKRRDNEVYLFVREYIVNSDSTCLTIVYVSTIVPPIKYEQ
jgi:hypothetical protein